MEIGELNGFVLQNLVLPTATHFSVAALCIRWPNGGGRLADADGLQLQPGEVVGFNTYYNAFSLLKWQKTAEISCIALHLKGSGRVRIRITQYCESGIQYPLLDRGIDLARNETIRLELMESLHPVALAFVLEALTGSEHVLIKGGYWLTTDEPRNDVRLASVVTTFRREQEATRTYARYRDEILPSLPGAHLFLIDNGETLDLPSTDEISVLSNENLGGAGGFARGLIEAQAAGCYTHVLFMDDDANCLPEAIFRTVALLRYATGERVAIAGAMLLEESPWVQYERSGELICSGEDTAPWKTHGAQRDLTKWCECIRNDLEGNGNYGGWWFFAFALKDVKVLPFPFFVRGDDTDFSLRNDLSITTLNGIATTCPNLDSKSTYATNYLATRSWMALFFLHGSTQRSKFLLKKLLRHASRLNRNWDYARANALLQAIEDALEGPRFFDRYPNAISRIKEIATFYPSPELTDEQRLRLVEGRKHKGLKAIFDRPRAQSGDAASQPIILVPPDISARKISSQGSPLKAEMREGALHLLTYRPEVELELKIRIANLAKRHTSIDKIVQSYHADEMSVRAPEAWAKRLKLLLSGSRR